MGLFGRQLSRGFKHFGKQLSHGIGQFGRQLGNVSGKIASGLGSAQRVVGSVEKAVHNVPILGGAVHTLNSGLGTLQGVANMGQTASNALSQVATGNLKGAYQSGKHLLSEGKGVVNSGKNTLTSGAGTLAQGALLLA